MAKMLKNVLTAMCCVAIIAAVPACNRDKDGHKKTKTTKYEKKTKVKKEKQPKESNQKANRKMTTERVETSTNY
jgi:ADP-ribosylglycohydrolase